MEQKPTEASPLVAEGDVKPARRCLEEYRGGVFETAFIIAYFVASQTGIILCNKLIAYEIPALPMTIMCIQMAFCAIVFCCPPILFWHNFKSRLYILSQKPRCAISARMSITSLPSSFEIRGASSCMSDREKPNRNPRNIRDKLVA